MKTILKLFLFTTIFTLCTQASDYIPYSAFTGSTVVPNDEEYYKYKENNREIIYTEDNLPFARHTASLENPLHDDYEKFYYWKLDETLYIGLISRCNQIANGFSTQWSNNRQINYMGGTQTIDYFSTTSWLDTLLYHETAHNYQYNVKGNVISRALHKVFGNGEFLLPFPYIIVPNVMENSFMLEGNAVLNESWHGNGGRLYSGRFKVQTILQAAHGNIVPSEVYNSKLAFPYGDIVYIQGGFYNYYLAQKYGLQKLNSYFRYHSQMFIWPFLTNSSMKKAVGVDFSTSLRDFAKEYGDMAEHLTLASGEHIASSQFFYSLGNDANEIFFITNESGVREPELVTYNKKTDSVEKDTDSFIGGKVIKVDGEYYTQGSTNVSPTKIYQGLFDSDAFIKENTESKMVQGYLSDATEVYFDVESSFSQAQLYVGSEFYAQVNSSVIIDKNDNLYYFIQDGKKRTLYKNKTPLYTYEGFYGMVSDVDSNGVVYFVANSEYGSTLYRYAEKKVTRAHEADNIVEARLVNDNEVLLAAISEKDYYYLKSDLMTIDKEPYETKLFFEDKEYYGEYEEVENAQEHYAHVDLSDSYNSLLDMHYSASELFLGSSDYGIIGSLAINFGDPLSQNAVSVFLNKDELNTTVTGVSYANSAYLFEYTITGYGVIESDDEDVSRNYGVLLNAVLPLYRAGYNGINLSASYYQDYDSDVRDPVSISLSFMNAQSYGVSMYPNYLNYLSIYTSLIDEDATSGLEYSFKNDLLHEFYLGVEAKYSQTDASIQEWINGVKITNLSYELALDPSTIYIPSLENSYYVKNAGYMEVNLAKVINFSSYWFTFPLSLQREAIYTKYRYYNIEDYYQNKHTFNEVTLGFTLSLVTFNNFVLPVSFEYIYNDADFIADENTFKVNLGISF